MISASSPFIIAHKSSPSAADASSKVVLTTDTPSKPLIIFRLCEPWPGKKKANDIRQYSSNFSTSPTKGGRQERLIIHIPKIDVQLPILVTLSSIKYKEVSYDLKVEGVTLPEVNNMLLEDGMRKSIDVIFDSVEWNAVDFEGLIVSMFGGDFLKNIENTCNIEGFFDYYLYDKSIENMRDRVLYNLKEMIFDTMSNDRDFEFHIYNSVNKIREVQTKIIREFNNITDKILTPEKDVVFFNTSFLVMCKVAITRGLVIFPENNNTSAVELSYREIRIRMMFESAEAQINANKMVKFAPLMRGGMI